MKLSRKEIDKLISKIRDKYIEYGTIYDKKWFNLTLFEERFLYAKKNKMNLQAFVLAEISNIETVKSKFEEKSSENSFTNKIDKIIEENNAKIMPYPAIEFHPKGHHELFHFYGAIDEFLQNIYPGIWLIQDSSIKDSAYKLENELVFFADRSSGRYSKGIDEHINAISRPNTTELDIDSSKNRFLKETAFILNRLIDFCDDILTRREEFLERPVDFSSLYIETTKKKIIIKEFSNLTGYGVILKIREKANTIIEDFRLSEFRLR